MIKRLTCDVVVVGAGMTGAAGPGCKGSLVLLGRTVVVAGTGPLLLPVATGLAAVGVKVAVLVESADPKALVQHAAALAASPDKLIEAAHYGAALIRHRIRVKTHHAVVAAHGSERLEAVTVAALDPERQVRHGTRWRIACDALAVGHGVLPHMDPVETFGYRTHAEGVAVIEEQSTDVPGVWAAGESTGIGGAVLSHRRKHRRTLRRRATQGCTVRSVHMGGGQDTEPATPVLRGDRESRTRRWRRMDREAARLGRNGLVPGTHVRLRGGRRRQSRRTPAEAAGPVPLGVLASAGGAGERA